MASGSPAWRTSQNAPSLQQSVHRRHPLLHTHRPGGGGGAGMENEGGGVRTERVKWETQRFTTVCIDRNNEKDVTKGRSTQRRA